MSQSPAVKMMLVTFADVTEVKLTEDPVTTVEVTTSPRLPA